MRQPIFTFDYTTDDNEATFGCASGRTEKEARGRLKRRYGLSDSEVATARVRRASAPLAPSVS